MYISVGRARYTEHRPCPSQKPTVELIAFHFENNTK